MDPTDHTLYSRWKFALAQTESNNNPRAWGDSGLACGRWQMHPVFVARWWPEEEPQDSTSWDEVFERCLRNFWDQLAKLTDTPVQLAMFFHLAGGPTKRWDPTYATRFLGFYDG